jgi:type II secretion system protein N
MVAIKKHKLLEWVGSAGFFFFCFSLFSYLTFPYDRVRDLLVRKVQASSAPGAPAPKLTIGELGPSWLTGVKLESISLERPPEIAGDPPTKLQADELRLRVAPLSLLFGGLGVKFAAEAGDGDVKGSYDADKDGLRHVEAELDALDLGNVGLGSLIGLPLEGKATGVVDVTLSSKPAETQGFVDLRIEGVKIGDQKGAKIKIPGMSGPLTLDAIDAGALDLKLAIKDGVATIERLESKGKDLALNGSGSIRVASELAQSRTDLTLGAKFDAGYRQRSDRTKSMFDILSMQRMVSSDGALRVKVTGPLNALRGVPAAPAAAPAPAGKASRARPIH